MKPYAIVFIVGVASAVVGLRDVSAQQASIKGGVSYGTASNTGLAPGAKQRSGFVLGVGVASGGPIGFGIEGLYAQRGYTSTNPGDSRRLDYIDVPLYLRLAVPSPAVSPFAYVGPQASFEIQCGTGGGDCPDSGRETVTYSGVIGVGARFGMLGGLTGEARYVYGLSDLTLNTVTSSSSYKPRSLLLLLSLGF